MHNPATIYIAMLSSFLCRSIQHVFYHAYVYNCTIAYQENSHKEAYRYILDTDIYYVQTSHMLNELNQSKKIQPFDQIFQELHSHKKHLMGQYKRQDPIYGSVQYFNALIVKGDNHWLSPTWNNLLQYHMMGQVQLKEYLQSIQAQVH